MRKSFFLVPLLALAMSSCSSDEPAVGGGETPDAQDGFYATVSFKMPTGSRADNGKVGEEEGQDYENKIGSILVILASENTEATTYDKANYQYVSHAYTDAPLFTAGDATTNKYTINFHNKESLFNYAENGGKTVSVFAYCNPPKSLVTEVEALATSTATDKSFTDDILSANASDTWQKNSFLMTSVKNHTCELPSQTTLKTYNTPTNAFNLTKDGAIEVIRTAVRFDYKDGATAKDEADKIIALTYRIKDISDNTKYQGTVKLTRAALFNMRDQFYYLPRTAAYTDGAITLCPDDMEVGHVVSPAEATFSFPITFEADKAFNPTSAGYTLEWTDLAALTEDDKDTGWVRPDGKDQTNYHIWRYATENTFAYNATAFPMQNTTGVVFEAEIALDETKFPDITVGTENMYLYNGTLYPTAKQVYEAAVKYPGTGLAAAFEKVFDVTGTGDAVTVTLKEAYKDALEAEGFTIYKPKNGKYYCYYYYFNKHNDNGKLEEIAPLEFATVRNNVYKLSVTKIEKFATFLPPTTIEDWDVYFSLDVQVRKWTVRVNNIEF